VIPCVHQAFLSIQIGSGADGRNWLKAMKIGRRAEMWSVPMLDAGRDDSGFFSR
jgi:hypothetical protein